MLWRLRKEIILITGILLSLFVVNKMQVKNSSLNQNISDVEQLVNYEEVIRENIRLRDLLKLKGKNFFFSKIVIGEVVSIKPFMCPGEIVVNKGKKDGIKKDMVVVSTEGYLVGRIIEAGDECSKVLTIFHPESRISVLIESTREIGVIEGGGVPFVFLKYISEKSKTQTGDEIITSGYSGFYPKGIKIGKIVKVKKIKNEFFLKAWLKPFSCFSLLDEVILGE